MALILEKVVVLAMAVLALAACTSDEAAEKFPAYIEPYVVELTLEAIRDADSRPARSTRLLVGGGNEVFGRWERYVTTDSLGIARLRVPAGEYAAYPMDPAFARGWIPLRGEGTSLPSTLRLRPACGLSGRVADFRGQPIAGARIETWAGTERIELETDRRGRFRIDRVPAGELVLSAYAEGYAFEDVAVELRAGEHLRGVAIVLRRGAALTVTVRCGGGPCAGARIGVDGAGEGDYGELEADSAGVAAFRDLRAGEAKVRAVRYKDLPGEIATPWIAHRLVAGETSAMAVTLEPAGGPSSADGGAPRRPVEPPGPP